MAFGELCNSLVSSTQGHKNPPTSRETCQSLWINELTRKIFLATVSSQNLCIIGALGRSFSCLYDYEEDSDKHVNLLFCLGKSE